MTRYYKVFYEATNNGKTTDFYKNFPSDKIMSTEEIVELIKAERKKNHPKEEGEIIEILDVTEISEKTFKAI